MFNERELLFLNFGSQYPKTNSKKNLKNKLEGKTPVTREELFELVNSWGRNEDIYINNNFYITTSGLNECYNLSKLDVSQIANMDYIFKYSLFNGDISNWDVSKVTSMKNMFYSAKVFNQPLDKWDVSNVTNMKSMFESSKTFNQNISNWDVSKVTNMNYMFCNAENFNQDISQWNISKVIDMSYMFYDTIKFNSPLNDWDVSNVINMESMFGYTLEFNQPLDKWNLLNIISMESMFNNAKKFNQNISSWDFNTIYKCNYLFNDAKAFEFKYNDGKNFPTFTEDIKIWFNENREKMNIMNIKEQHGDEIDNFFNNFNLISIDKQIKR